ncbi:hypothetical protein LCGC14_2706060 [marine sediment metagenome]|uniref:HTH cro/C1-type domain-containing protein n=1 Tax=marine sediment metagenome TaxID=412755 RepID=A0A0F9BNE2_9ZZZZ
MRTDPEIVIPRKVNSLRKNEGWTQKRLAEEAGTTQATISRIESAMVANVSISMADGLAQAFGITIDELIQ